MSSFLSGSRRLGQSTEGDYLKHESGYWECPGSRVGAIAATRPWMKKWNVAHASVGSAPVQPQPRELCRTQVMCVHVS